jgi:hypothetical protein
MPDQFFTSITNNSLYQNPTFALKQTDHHMHMYDNSGPSPTLLSPHIQTS